MACDERVLRAVRNATRRAEKHVIDAIDQGRIVEEEEITAFLAFALEIEFKHIRLPGINASSLIVPRRKGGRAELAKEKYYGGDLILGFSIDCGGERASKTLSFQAKNGGIRSFGKVVKIEDGLDRLRDQVGLLVEWTSEANALFYQTDGFKVATAKDIASSKGNFCPAVTLPDLVVKTVQCQRGDREWPIASWEDLKMLMRERNVATGLFVRVDGDGWVRRNHGSKKQGLPEAAIHRD